jgi:hypothetical protein
LRPFAENRLAAAFAKRTGPALPYLLPQGVQAGGKRPDGLD